jgi:hypothetical protein
LPKDGYSRKMLIVKILYIFQIPMILMFGGCYNNAVEYRDLRNRHVAVIATIASKNCWNHGDVRYHYKFGNGDYYNQAEFGSTDCRRVRIGEPITIYVSPDHPEISTNIDPEAAYARYRGWHLPLWILALVAVSLTLVIGIRQKRPVER